MKESEIIQKYLLDKIQTISLDKNGIITASNNSLFEATVGKDIKDYHPFFELTSYLFLKDNDEITFHTITLDFTRKTIVSDIIISTGNKIDNGSIIIFDYSEHYTSVQEVTQQKNEMFIKNFFSSQKILKAEEERILKNKILANITNDLKTPISSVKALLDLFNNNSLTFEQKGLLKSIQTSTNQVNRIIDDVLELTKSDIGILNIEMATFDFEDLIKHIEKQSQAEFLDLDSVIQITKSPRIPRHLVGDSNRILQIITNLLRFIFLSSPNENVHLNIEIDNLSPKKVGLNFTLKYFEKQTHELASAEQLNKNVLSNSKQNNLHLELAKNIIILLNGNIKLQNSQKESYIKIFLPFEIDVLKSKDIARKQAFHKIEIVKNYTVLLIDDIELNQLILMKLLLNHAGFYIDISYQMENSETLISKNNYDLIFINLQTKTLDGFELISNIRNNNNKTIKKTPIIALSSFETEIEKKACKKIKINSYLIKPFTAEELYSNIYNALKLV
ncbi:response regulator [Flavobacterium sp.]|uniref:hybrid sensor histidine kinase/response regulator n=1 Tax=Flavobacterium sp. TaxID=239 RepID=UPI00286BDEB6|nr:response regulator [Flavobacterium sp.]